MAYAPQVYIGNVEYTDITIQNVNVVYGRQRLTELPQATQATLVLLYEGGSQSFTPTAAAVGELVEVLVDGRTRFYGYITDSLVQKYTLTINAVGKGLAGYYNAAAYYYDSAGTDPPGTYTMGVGTTPFQLWYNLFSDWLRSDESWPWPPLPGSPLTFKNPASGDTTTTVGNPGAAGRVQQAYTETPSGTLATAAEPIINLEPVGVIYEDYSVTPLILGPDLKFGSQADRASLTPNLTLSADEVLDNWNTGPDTAQVVTRVVARSVDGSVVSTFKTDGVNNTATEQTVTFATGSTTVMAPAVIQILSRGRAPVYWATITIPAGRNITDVRREEIIDELCIGRLVETPLLATGLPEKWYLEGYTETIRASEYLVTLRLSDPAGSYRGQQWSAVTPSLTWAGVATDVTWNTLRSLDL